MSREMAPEKKRYIRIRKLARAHGVLTMLVFSVYFSAGLFLHPTFLVSDVREKITVMADTLAIFARVLASPAKPVVTATSVCANGGPTIVLDWADDDNSVSYNIARDSLPLSTGAITSGYTDTAVEPGQTIRYIVTALGPMGPGFNDSDLVTVTALAECDPDVIPTIEVQTVVGRNIVGTSERQYTTDRTPRFTGVTNLSGARIDIRAISNHEVIETTVYANSNGYYEWSSASRFDFDSYDVTFTATDIQDSSLSVSQTIKMSIEKEEISTSDKQETSTNTDEQSIQTQSPIDFDLELSETDLYSGDHLEATISTQKIFQDLFDGQVGVSFIIIDGEGKIIDHKTEEIIKLIPGFKFKHQFRIPFGMANREYHLLAEVSTAKHRSVQEAAFRVSELPLLSLGAATVTYEQAVSQVGWISFLLLFLLFWWLLLFLREYYLSSRSERHINGHDLHRAGYF